MMGLLSARVLQRVVITDLGCWEWQGAKNKGGYGRINNRRRWLLTHRVIAHVWLGLPDDPKVTVLHRCDNPPCCNPLHLRIGTIADNQQDMVAKGRSRKGSRHWKTRLTESEVREIRAAYRPRVVTYAMLSERYGVARQTLCNIVKRRAWQHV